MLLRVKVWIPPVLVVASHSTLTVRGGKEAEKTEGNRSSYKFKRDVANRTHAQPPPGSPQSQHHQDQRWLYCRLNSMKRQVRLKNDNALDAWLQAIDYQCRSSVRGCTDGKCQTVAAATTGETWHVGPS